MEYIKFTDVYVSINGNNILRNITFSTVHPTFLSIMGPNGAGKTTLLKTMLGLLKPDRGKVEILGYNPVYNPISIRRLVGYVPQKDYITRDLPVKVKDVVLMGILINKSLPRYPSPKDIENALEALRTVEMEWAWDKRFSQLSGGEQQRVLIARGIANKPKILLLDEPFNKIDMSTQAHIIEFLHRIKSRNVSIFIVTHDINPISAISDLIMILNKEIIAIGKPREVLRKEVLMKVYGSDVRIFDGHPCPIVVTGDTHV
jgi:ABC-type Mn2+/Zn2+ transport system ATPase subunit